MLHNKLIFQVFMIMVVLKKQIGSEFYFRKTKCSKVFEKNKEVANGLGGWNF